jgi:hypothetical protein
MIGRDALWPEKIRMRSPGYRKRFAAVFELTAALQNIETVHVLIGSLERMGLLQSSATNKAQEIINLKN